MLVHCNDTPGLPPIAGVPTNTVQMCSTLYNPKIKYFYAKLYGVLNMSKTGKLSFACFPLYILVWHKKYDTQSAHMVCSYIIRERETLAAASGFGMTTTSSTGGNLAATGRHKAILGP